MIREEVKALKTEARDLRKFGLTVGGVFVLLGLAFWWRQKPYYPFALVPGVLLVALGLARPRSLRLIYLAWMAVALALGVVVSSVVLTLFFYLVMTPVGLLARAFGKDYLSRKLDRHAKSYWLYRDVSTPKQKSDYEQQF